MHASPATPVPSQAEGEHTSSGIYWFLGGAILAVVGLTFVALIDALAIALVQKLLGRESCAVGLPTYAIVGLMLFVVALTVGVGFWLRHMRRWVGTKVDYDDRAWGEHIRTRYTQGAMTVLCIGAPVQWLLMLGTTYCFGAQ